MKTGKQKEEGNRNTRNDNDHDEIFWGGFNSRKGFGSV